MVISKIHEVAIGVGRLIDRCTMANGSQAEEAVLTVKNTDMRPVFDAAKLMEKFAPAADDSDATRRAAEVLTKMVDRCKGPDGKVAAVSTLVLYADEIDWLNHTIHLLNEQEYEKLSSATRRPKGRK